jgi:hypothetical protein
MKTTGFVARKPAPVRPAERPQFGTARDVECTAENHPDGQLFTAIIVEKMAPTSRRSESGQNAMSAH